jgi:hypothetical protein
VCASAVQARAVGTVTELRKSLSQERTASDGVSQRGPPKQAGVGADVWLPLRWGSACARGAEDEGESPWLVQSRA